MKTKNIVIIGSVAAGTSVAAKARRNDETSHIIVFDKDTDISYSVCGIPYYIGGEIAEIDELTPRDAKWFKDRFNIDIHTSHEVLAIDKDKKMIEVKNLLTGDTFNQSYDELVLATGSRPRSIPQIDDQAYHNVFQVKTINDAKLIHHYIEVNNVKEITIVGGGFIGLEMLEQLAAYRVRLIQRSALMSQLDEDMSFMIEDYLADKAELHTYSEIAAVQSDCEKVTGIELTDGSVFATDLVILAVGVVPNTELASNIGVMTGMTGAVKINERLETNVPHIYAVGDVAEAFHVHTKAPMYRPLGSTANKMGRIVGDRLTGGDLTFRGILGTGIVRVFDMTIAQTGYTEKEALAAGVTVDVIHNIKPNRPEYMKGREMTIKAVIDRDSEKIIGAQIIGYEGVDKRIDVLATAITFGAKAEDLFHLDLAYTPAFSTTKDPVIYTGMISHNITRGRKIMTPEQLLKRIADHTITVLDVRSPKQYEQAHVRTAINVPLQQLRHYAEQMDKSKPVVTYCNKGTTGNAAQNILINLGFNEVYNLSGGNTNYQRYMKMSERKERIR
ncbi:dehydrogenase [Macrococcus brunensis]|uniref:Dehydrogenase n=1 Tax=Macrococcus brunensis TaxID=198483 RepID=A0A4R6BBM9_9STAP|nr:FAD-dependent oxidoreductase [Macrococcus brunensis]TDL95242.1 dehydrogenase [Macrococcus brunensis]ULG74481.1 FAD-dependent oxidoreductase [Macrococcus brunensis]